MSKNPTTLTQPYRGSGTDRPQNIPLPPVPMPLLYGGRLRKRWRYVSLWSREVSICAARAWIGPVAQEFWAVWDRVEGRLWERTRLWHGRVGLPLGRLVVRDGAVVIDLVLEENEGFEVVTPSGRAYTWTRKQGCVPAQGTVSLGGVTRRVEAVGLIDDNDGYHPRHTRWQWSGGAGQDQEGQPVAWSVITGLNDSPVNSERVVWVEGEAQEVGPVRFAADLSSVAFAEGGQLEFRQEAVRQRRDNLLLIRSTYAQPFGTFSGSLPGGIELGEAYGVMERHDVVW